MAPFNDDPPKINTTMLKPELVNEIRKFMGSASKAFEYIDYKLKELDSRMKNIEDKIKSLEDR